MMRNIILCSICIMFLICGSVLALSVSIPSKSDIKFIDKEIKETSEKHDIEVKYPNILYLFDKNTQDKSNKYIDSFVNEKVANFKNNEKEFWEGYLEEKKSYKDEKEFAASYPQGKSSLSVGTYEVLYSDRGIVSIFFNIEAYFIGSAHGSPQIETVNYDLNNGSPIELKDIFLPNAKYLNFISSYSVNELLHNKELMEGSNAGWVREGAGPNGKNFKKFNLLKSGLNISFDVYQVAPFSWGTVRIVLPYKKLKNIMKPEWYKLLT